ncbi:Zn-ribbon domain-containing OB-fold protein [Actinomadura sp. HBU206391]|uniref:Zn-ribbon domain-containing OB-fold protein n=1 Tax=Actinomadura sp. HBU206391 TaxID=2731692 RepID=UPI001650409D|nr:OB-fold domain-containing protein [Actinomadura sp. HBU206391]MBC6461241.1 OB-fold domain-containing protein [Actinomadura sp. HBU206391]
MDHARPLPSPTPLTAPYWDACRRGELLIQHCAGCGRFVHFPEPACPYCGGADLPYDEVSGHGRVHTYSVVHRTFLPGFEVPYVLAWIDLDEGARAFGDVVGCPPEDVRIGSRVRVCFEDLPGFGAVPRWRPLLAPVPAPEG